MPAKGPKAPPKDQPSGLPVRCKLLIGRQIGLDVQVADQPCSVTGGCPKLDTALSQSSPTQAKPIVRSAAGTSGHAPADAGADMSMQPEARGAVRLAGAEHEVGPLVS